MLPILSLRWPPRKRYPDRKIAYRMPWSPVLPIISALACFWLMLNLTTLTWVRFAVWLVIGLVIYFSYSRRHSLLNPDSPRHARAGAPDAR